MKKMFMSLVFFLLAVSPWLTTTKVLYLKDPPVWPDEAIYVETASNILKTGVMKTDLFGSFAGLNQHALWYPPLYFYVLALWIKIFGESIEIVRSLSVIFGFLSLIILFILLQKKFSKLWLSFLGVLLLSNDMFFSASSRVGRMDMMNFFFITASIFFLVLAIEGKIKWIWGVVGIFCGLAILSHPYGSLAPTVILIYLLLWRHPLKSKIEAGVWIILPIFMAFLIWLMVIGGDFSLFLTQYNLQFQRKFMEESVPISIFKTNDYLSIGIYAAYIIFIVGLIIKLIKKYQEWDAFLVASVLISVTVAIWGKEFWFFLYFQPFLALLASTVIYTLYKAEKNLLLFFCVILVTLILSLNVYYYLGYYWQVGNKPDYHEFTKLISNHLPPKAKIFLASIPDPYFDLRKNPNYSFYEFPTVPITSKEYKTLLDDSDYIIYNMETIKTVKDYIVSNGKNIVSVRQPGGFTTKVIQLNRRD